MFICQIYKAFLICDSKTRTNFNYFVFIIEMKKIICLLIILFSFKSVRSFLKYPDKKQSNFKDFYLTLSPF
jgi:hypothetical protein